MSKTEFIKQAVNTIISSRDDLSHSLVHLTREYAGISAKENLISILKSRQIEARNIDCYRKLDIPSIAHNEFKVLSFTETPFNQIDKLVNIPFSRKVNLEAYGLAFDRKYIIEGNGSPVIYVYNKEQQAFYDHLIDMYISIANSSYNPIQDLPSRILPFIKIINENEDFHWEREWKFRKNFNFDIHKCTIIVPTIEEAEDIFLNIGTNYCNFYIVQLNKLILLNEFTDIVGQSEDDLFISEGYEISEYTDDPNYQLSIISRSTLRQYTKKNSYFSGFK